MNDIIKTALAEYGNEPIAGPRTNPDILKYFHETGYDYINEDETPWCAAFVSWILKKCNKNIKSTLRAKDFLEIGEATTSPVMGDIAIIYSNDPKLQFSHVSFYVRELGPYFFLLGGNQSNMVMIKAYSKTLPISFRKIA